ncbi:MAG: hypothetical protein EOM59_11630 [Clostridia bacterium]|nr:hypothetical protein [Clostridia bacterium]
MKKLVTIILLICLLAVMTGCGEERHTPEEWCRLEVVNTFNQYNPEQEFVILQVQKAEMEIFTEYEDLPDNVMIEVYTIAIFYDNPDTDEEIDVKRYIAFIHYKLTLYQKTFPPRLVNITEYNILDLDVAEYEE